MTKPIDTTEQRLKLLKYRLTDAGNESKARDNKTRWTSFRWNLCSMLTKHVNTTELKLSKCRLPEVRTRFGSKTLVSRLFYISMVKKRCSEVISLLRIIHSVHLLPVPVIVVANNYSAYAK